jgi:hypothetical protein
MPDLTTPTGGARRILTPTAGGTYSTRSVPLEDPLDGATDQERAYYIAHYQDVPMAELLRRLRTAEWDSAHYKGEYEAARGRERQYPPLTQVRNLAARMRRVQQLLDTPRRRTFTKDELHQALYGAPAETAAAPAA